MKSDRLDGWKDISRYLQRDVRTCQRWEKDFGLPVYRLDAQSDRSKLYSFRSELDEWLRSKAKINNGEKTCAPHRSLKILAMSVIIVTSLVVMHAVFSRSKDRDLFTTDAAAAPADWNVNDTGLAFFSAGGDFLWSVDIDNPADLTTYYWDTADDLGGLVENEIYRRSRVDFSDVDADGRYEVLIALQHEDPRNRAVVLYDNEGTEIWQRGIEFDQEYASGRFPVKFLINQLNFHDIDGDGREEALVLWVSEKRFPSVFNIYDRNGREILKYIHTGRLQFFKVLTCTDKKHLIFLGGTNNLLNNDAGLVVLDCDNLGSGTGPPYGVSEDLVDYTSRIQAYVPVDPVPARQLYYIRFKQNEYTRAAGITWHYVLNVEGGENGIEVYLQYGKAKLAPLYFRFDPGFNLKEVAPSAEFKNDCQALEKRGFIRKSIEDILAERGTDVLFWDGEGWTPRPVILRDAAGRHE